MSYNTALHQHGEVIEMIRDELKVLVVEAFPWSQNQLEFMVLFERAALKSVIRYVCQDEAKNFAAEAKKDTEL